MRYLAICQTFESILSQDDCPRSPKVDLNSCTSVLTIQGIRFSQKIGAYKFNFGRCSRYGIALGSIRVSLTSPILTDFHAFYCNIKWDQIEVANLGNLIGFILNGIK